MNGNQIKISARPELTISESNGSVLIAQENSQLESGMDQVVFDVRDIPLIVGILNSLMECSLANRSVFTPKEDR